MSSATSKSTHEGLVMSSTGGISSCHLLCVTNNFLGLSTQETLCQGTFYSRKTRDVKKKKSSINRKLTESTGQLV